jgi:hypothetical protein
LFQVVFLLVCLFVAATRSLFLSHSTTPRSILNSFFLFLLGRRPPARALFLILSLFRSLLRWRFLIDQFKLYFLLGLRGKRDLARRATDRFAEQVVRHA